MSDIMEPLKFLRTDLKAGRGNVKSQMIVVLFRVAAFMAGFKKRLFPVWVLCIPALILYRFYVEWLLGVEILPKCQIGPGLCIEHGQGSVINDQAVIGSFFRMRHGVTIGNQKASRPSDCPTVGNHVDVGCNASILGKIEIGDGAVIAAGAVVVKDVPEHAIVAGVPARIIGYTGRGCDGAFDGWTA